MMKGIYLNLGGRIVSLATSEGNLTAFFVTISTIWKCRNKAIFEKKEITKEEAIQQAMFWLEQWIERAAR